MGDGNGPEWGEKDRAFAEQNMYFVLLFQTNICILFILNILFLCGAFKPNFKTTKLW